MSKWKVSRGEAVWMGIEAQMLVKQTQIPRFYPEGENMLIWHKAGRAPWKSCKLIISVLASGTRGVRHGPEGHTACVRSAFLSLPRGQLPRGQLPRGQPPRVQLPRGQLPRGQPPRVQPPRGQPPRVQPPRGQLPRVQL